MIAALYVQTGGVYYGLARSVELQSKLQRSRTPVPFRDLLIDIAASAGGAS